MSASHGARPRPRNCAGNRATMPAIMREPSATPIADLKKKGPRKMFTTMFQIGAPSATRTAISRVRHEDGELHVLRHRCLPSKASARWTPEHQDEVGKARSRRAHQCCPWPDSVLRPSEVLGADLPLMRRGSVSSTGRGIRRSSRVWRGCKRISSTFVRA